MIWPTRSSVVRHTRDTSDTSTMVPMKNAAIFTPSGRSMTLMTVVYANTSAMNAANSGPALQRPFSRRTDSVTAVAPLVISTSTPVA